jgi:hypothetical protein
VSRDRRTKTCRTQRTPKGYEIPVPKRGDVERDLKKIAAPQRDRGREKKPNP